MNFKINSISQTKNILNLSNQYTINDNAKEFTGLPNIQGRLIKPIQFMRQSVFICQGRDVIVGDSRKNRQKTEIKNVNNDQIQEEDIKVSNNKQIIKYHKDLAHSQNSIKQKTEERQTQEKKTNHKKSKEFIVQKYLQGSQHKYISQLYIPLQKQLTKKESLNVKSVKTNSIYDVKSKMTNRLSTLPQLEGQKSQKVKQTMSANMNRPILSPLMSSLKSIKSQSFILLQHGENTIITAHRSKVSLEIASLTKIMTFYCIIDIIKLNNLDMKIQKITVDEDLQCFNGTSADLIHGERYTLEQMLYGMMLPSGNDAAMCLARWAGRNIAGSKRGIKTFIQFMNIKAKQLGLEGTKFANPHGLPHSQSRSTVYDVAKLCSQCLKDDFFRQVVSSKSYKCKIQNIRVNKKFVKEWENTNKLLRRKNFIGIKTGITVTAGPCLASAYIFKQKTYIVVLAQCNKVSRRFKQTRHLLATVLTEIYGQSLNDAERKTLKYLYKTNHDIDSDYSSQERQFNYKVHNASQLKRRANIITNET